MRFATLLLLLALPGLSAPAHSAALFEKRLNMRVYQIETLASVVNRIEVQLGLRISYKPALLVNKAVKPATYTLISAADILKEQLTFHKLVLVKQNRGYAIVQDSAKPGN
ncbi:hypothetical protein [Pedobacter yulinensis]|nr:hypothetical protein [Pedobacter yulinensis]